MNASLKNPSYRLLGRSLSIVGIATSVLLFSCSSEDATPKPDPSKPGHSEANQGKANQGKADQGKAGKGKSAHGRPITGKHVPGPLHDARETHLTNIRQITFRGENAEAYWSFKGDKLVLQARKGDTGFKCDQIYEYDVKTAKGKLVSTGKGRTTCSYFTRDDKRIIYASTHHHDAACPQEADMSRGYVWSIYDSFDIFSVSRTDPKDFKQLTFTPGYDAEPTVDPATGRIIFTSMRDGDLELYSMKDDGSDVVRLTKRLGYDGGAFYSMEGDQIVWRSTKFKDDAERDAYRTLLKQNLVKPSKMEIWYAKADGSEPHQVTDNGKANFAPYFMPGGKKILFSSNIESTREFNIYMINKDGTGQKRITYSSAFNSFAMFSPDGKYLAFASNRNNEKRGDTNIFIAEWKD